MIRTKDAEENQECLVLLFDICQGCTACWPVVHYKINVLFG